MNPESFLSNFRGSYHVARLEWNYYINNKQTGILKMKIKSK